MHGTDYSLILLCACSDCLGSSPIGLETNHNRLAAIFRADGMLCAPWRSLIRSFVFKYHYCTPKVSRVLQMHH